MARSLSFKGALFIGRFEGFADGKLYNDLNGDAHIGFGHRLHDGPYTQADIDRWHPPITQEKAAALLQVDAKEVADHINEHVREPLRQGQFDAMVSLGFNLGPYSEGLAEVIRLINAGRPPDARRNFLLYDHDANGVRWAGLTRRRRYEAKLFRTGNYYLNAI